MTSEEERPLELRPLGEPAPPQTKAVTVSSNFRKGHFAAALFATTDACDDQLHQFDRFRERVGIHAGAEITDEGFELGLERVKRITGGELNLPRPRYDVPGATGGEVAILDLHQGTGDVHPSVQGAWNPNLHAHPTAKAIVAKNIRTKTLSGAPVTVMCDPTTVRPYLPS